MGKHILVLLFALAAVACGEHAQQVELPSRLEPQGLDAAQAEFLNAAAEQWFIASDGKLDLLGATGTAIPVRPATSDGTWMARTDIKADGLSMVVDDAELTRNAERHREDVATFYSYSFQHEIGHLFGLDHVEGGLMALDTPRHPKPCIDAVTLELACANYGGCGPGAHPTCEESAE